MDICDRSNVLFVRGFDTCTQDVSHDVYWPLNEKIVGDVAYFQYETDESFKSILDRLKIKLESRKWVTIVAHSLGCMLLLLSLAWVPQETKRIIFMTPKWQFPRWQVWLSALVPNKLPLYVPRSLALPASQLAPPPSGRSKSFLLRVNQVAAAAWRRPASVSADLASFLLQRSEDRVCEISILLATEDNIAPVSDELLQELRSINGVVVYLIPTVHEGWSKLESVDCWYKTLEYSQATR